MANKIGYAGVSVGQLTDVDTVARNPVGTVQQDEACNSFIYLKGVASTAAGDWVVFYGDYTTARAVDTPLIGRVAVAMAASVASNWGWYQIFGLTPTYTNIATNATGTNKSLYLSSTAGQASVTSGATKGILNAFAYGNPTGSTGQAWIANPFVYGNAVV